jgi:hypothetical protein
MAALRKNPRNTVGRTSGRKGGRGPESGCEDSDDVTFDLYAWKSPRDLDDDRAEALVQGWQDAGGDPSRSPFEPSTDVGWFHRELMKDEPGLEASSDAVPNPSTTPIWLAGTDEPPARVVAISLSPATPREALDTIFGLATKYDLVLFDAASRRLHFPLEEMAAYASATFWPAGAIQAAVAGGIGGVIAVVAWFVGIPLVSGVLMLVGGFMFVMAVYTFIHEGRKAAKSRRAGGE